MMFNIFIGYDRDNRMPAYTCAESIMQNSSIPVSFTFLHREMLKEFTRPRGPHDSTEFSNSRFLVPYLSSFTGWSLFLDNDIIVRKDIAQLLELASSNYAVMCVKHNQQHKSDTKFLGRGQYPYQCKNWSSVMLFNNAKCKALTLDYVNTANGLDMHQFKWLDSLSLVGELPQEWNYLVGYNNQDVTEPSLIHYTDGGPYFSEYKQCEYADKWLQIYKQINDVRSESDG